jgi:hypothetical protein
LVKTFSFWPKFQSTDKSPFATIDFLSEKQWSMREKSGDKEKRYLELWNRVEAEMEKPKVIIKTIQIAALCVQPDPVRSASFWWIRIRTYTVQPNVKRNYTFSRKFQCTVQNIKNYDS